MADKPENEKAKKPGPKLFAAAAKLPLDGIVLVIVPFVAFVLLFLYVMGFVPPRPLSIKVVTSDAAAGTEITLPASPNTETALGGTLDAGGGSAPGSGEAAVPGESVPEAGAAGEGGLPEVEGAGLPEAGASDAVDVGGVESFTAAFDSSLARQARIERVKQLAKVYEQMNATSVAAIVINMSNDDAIEILSQMKARNAAKVLASLEPERAAALSLILTGKVE